MKDTTRTAGQTAQTTQEVSVSIDDVAELYRSTVEQIKEFTDYANKYKEQLIQYGNDHQEEWTKDGLAFDNGVRLIKKVTNKQFYDEDDIDIDWLEGLVSRAGGSVVKIGFDQKKLQKAMDNNFEVERHLESISYRVEPVETVAVLLK